MAEELTYEVAEEPMVVSPEELLIANYEALKAVFAAALAQVIGGDALTARQIFLRLTEDVDRERKHYIELARQAKAEVEAIVEEE